MRYFVTLLFLRLKAGVRSAFFWGLLILLTGLSFAFCSLLPQRPQVNVQVGLLAEESPVSTAAKKMLLENEDYRFTLYPDEAGLQRAVLTGEVHCAYRISAEDERPVTLYAGKSAYMTPVLNEVVLSAYLDASTPLLTAELLTQMGERPPEGAAMEAYFAELRERSKPMTVTLTSAGKAADSEAQETNWAERYGDSGMQTLLYALLGALLPAAAILQALLRGKAENAVRFPGGHAAASALAPLCADALLSGVALLAADAVIAALYPGLVYSFLARLAAIGALAVLSAVCAALLLPLARRPAVPLLLLPVVLVLWVLLSGGIIDPALLPNGLGELRLVSPAWYFLKIMTLLSV